MYSSVSVCQAYHLFGYLGVKVAKNRSIVICNLKVLDYPTERNTMTSIVYKCLRQDNFGVYVCLLLINNLPG